MKLEHKNVWYGYADNISLEINNFQLHPGDRVRWTYYLSVPITLVEKELGEGYMGIEHDSPLFDLEWHGGITYCERVGEKVTIGCDFSHYCDEGIEYKYEDIHRKLMKTFYLFKKKFNI